jgi:hypothetical protein
MAGETGLLTAGLVWGNLEPIGRWRIAFGSGVFVTTGTSVTVYCPFDTLACPAIVFPGFVTAAQAANGQLSHLCTPNSTTGLVTVTSNSITVARIAGTDSALSFGVLMIGR